jgi:hypothetical protein
LEPATQLTGILASAAAALAVALPVSQPSLYSDAVPPARFQHNATVELEIAGQQKIDQTCHSLFGQPPTGMKTDACTTGRHLILPDPCAKAATESYARLLCHELAHANGWPSTHGD